MSRETLIEKARRLRDEGRVYIIKHTSNYLHAEVDGDHNRYSVMIWFDKKQNVTKAKCGCKWNILRHKGKWCSHIRAVLSFWGKERKVKRSGNANNNVAIS